MKNIFKTLHHSITIDERVVWVNEFSVMAIASTLWAEVVGESESDSFMMKVHNNLNEGATPSPNFYLYYLLQ